MSTSHQTLTCDENLLTAGLPGGIGLAEAHQTLTRDLHFGTLSSTCSGDKSSKRHQTPRRNPLLGAYRVSAALEQMGIKLSRATCGRYLSINRSLYHLQMPRKPRPKAEMPFRAERRQQLWSVDIRYLDMHSLKGVEMVYCISILENVSRAILASAISLRQDNEAFFAVFYAAVRKHGVPEILVSDNGSIFTSHATRRVCEQLGIEKKEIKKGRPYQNYIEAAFNVQRRMADWYFEEAKTYEDLLATHEKWVRAYNYQKHFAHEQREDGRHSPAEVLGWVAGKQFEPDYMYRAFSAIGETRTLTKAGYARFRDFLLYGERGLAGNKCSSISFRTHLPWSMESNHLPNILWNGSPTTKASDELETPASTIILIKVRSLNFGQLLTLSGT